MGKMSAARKMDIDVKNQLLALTREYQAALKRHLGERPALHPWRAARRLGERAVALRLETLDLARIHRKALTVMVDLGNKPKRAGMVRRAGRFFTNAIIPIEKTHCAGMKAAAFLKDRNQALRERTAQLSATNLHLKEGVVRRKAAEGALVTHGREQARLLKHSRQLQKQLRELARQIMSTEERERRKISVKLQDEIAQTLLGINVRLLTLRRGASDRTQDLAKDIASTQRLVQKSARTISRFAREFSIKNEA